jgi:hypothetical protein
MITEEKQVIIAYDDSNDMIEITRGDECVFYGNEWDFHRDAKSLGRFLSMHVFFEIWHMLYVNHPLPNCRITHSVLPSCPSIA